MSKIKFCLSEGATMPSKAHPTDAGFDLCTPHHVTVPGCSFNFFKQKSECGAAVVNTGVHIQIPEGYVGFIKSKSGLNVKHDITAEGVIDSGYTGPIIVKLYNHGPEDYTFKRGDKITQLVILPICTDELEWVDDLEETERGDKGFGSSGK